MRKKTKAATAYLAGMAALGGGVLALAQLADGRSEKNGEVVSMPEASPSTAAASPAGSTKADPAQTTPAAVPTVKLPKEASERLAAALEAGKKDVEVQRPIPRMGPAVNSEVTVKEHGSVQKDGKMLKVVSARQDLSGHRELTWVADEGKTVGKAKCSQKIKLSNEAQPRVRPTLLICWRTSSEKSVYTVSVNLDKKPSMRESVAAIDKAWAKLD